MLEKFGCGAKECRWFGWKKFPHQNQTLKAIQLCHPSIVQRWTSYHKDIFQYINGESIITFFLFLLLLFLRSEQSDKWQRQFQILDKWRRKKTHFSALQITWNPFPCLLFLLCSSLATENIWLLSIFKTCVGQIKLEETAQYLASGWHIARFHLRKDRIGNSSILFDDVTVLVNPHLYCNELMQIDCGFCWQLKWEKADSKPGSTIYHFTN